MESGNSVNWFNGDFDLAIDFINNIGGETIGNFLMFLPFGFLYPLSQKEVKWENIILKGITFVLLLRYYSQFLVDYLILMILF